MTSNSKSFNLATPETYRRSSQDLADEAPDEIHPDDPVTPTPNPTTQNPPTDGLSEMKTLLAQQQVQFQQYVAERDAQQQSRIDQLQHLVQQTYITQHQAPQLSTDAAQSAATPDNPTDDPITRFAQVMQMTTEQTNANITASLRAHATEQQSGPRAKQAEESRLNSLANTHWHKKDKLIGYANFTQWKKSMETDAIYIDASNVLSGRTADDENTDMGRHSLTVRARLLHARLAARMTPEVGRAVHIDDTFHPAIIWQRLHDLYSVSKAEERLAFTKTALNLMPQGNPIEMLHQWEELNQFLHDRQYTAQELFHDMAIILMGDWQKTFMTAQLDELFTKSKRNDQHVFDMPD